MTDTAKAPTEAAETTSNRNRHLGWALVLISIAQLMVVLDGTIVNIALPFIQKDLDIATANLRWVVTGYALAFGSLLLLGGRLGDLFGRRRIFMTGLVVFGVASLLGGLATNEGLLLAARALQGLGAALASPAALALIATTFPAGPARSRAFAVYAAMSGVGAAVGLLLGGWLTGLDSVFGLGVEGWRLTLLINMPIGVITALLAPRFLAESESHPGELDLPGAVTGTLGLLGLVYGLSRAGTDGWGDLWTVASLVAGVSPARGLHVHGAPHRAPAAAAPGLRQPHPWGQLRGDVLRPGGDVRDVLLPQPVHPDGDGLQPDPGGCRVPAVLLRPGGRGRHLLEPDQPDQPALPRGRRHPDGCGGTVRVLPAALRHHVPDQQRAGQLPHRPAAVHPADVLRDGDDVRAADADRRAPPAGRGLGHRLGGAEHDAAGGWSPRALPARHRRDADHRQPRHPPGRGSAEGGRSRRSPALGGRAEGGPGRRLPPGVHRGCDGSVPARRRPDDHRLSGDVGLPQRQAPPSWPRTAPRSRSSSEAGAGFGLPGRPGKPNPGRHNFACQAPGLSASLPDLSLVRRGVSRSAPR